jgi:flavin reductase (DIM6/NTAB) family NADH-FMN oxidoreductase RutF
MRSERGQAPPTPVTAEQPQWLDGFLRDKFLEGMSRAATTVSIVTTDGPGGRAGVTVSAMTSVSAEAGASPTLLVCIHHQSPAAKAVRRNAVFCVNLLRDNQSAIAERFAGRLKDGDKFSGAQWTTLKTGSPATTEALASFDCELESVLRQGTHWIFIGRVAGVSIGDERNPLIYANRTYNGLQSAS